MTEMTTHECKLLQMARNSEPLLRMDAVDRFDESRNLGRGSKNGGHRWRSAENAPIMKEVIRMVLAWKIMPSRN